jgi:hypothetical protein
MSDASANGVASFRDRIRVYQVNRCQFAREQLLPHVGKWAAFSADGKRIIASSESLANLESCLKAQGMDPQEVLFEQIHNDDENSIEADLM